MLQDYYKVSLRYAELSVFSLLVNTLGETMLDSPLIIAPLALKSKFSRPLSSYRMYCGIPSSTIKVLGLSWDTENETLSMAFSNAIHDSKCLKKIFLLVMQRPLVHLSSVTGGAEFTRGVQLLSHVSISRRILNSRSSRQLSARLFARLSSWFLSSGSFFIKMGMRRFPFSCNS